MDSVPVPFAVRPKEVPLIWGGDALIKDFGKPGQADETIGESWECWDENPASRGPYAGETIAVLRGRFGRALVGALDPAKRFPVLTKFIDARAPLSVQVHPDDAYAQRVEHQPNGKTECWVVLDAAPGSQIVLGWNREVSREEYLRRVADGSLGDVLRKRDVKPGDVYYLPSGTVHSIGAGIVLYEVQQTSDLTYRIFDWNRVGPDGKPRELNVAKAADVLDYHADSQGALASLDYEYDGVHRSALVADPRFIVERIATGPASGSIDLDGMPLVVTALAGPLQIVAGDAALELAPYETAIVPAEYAAARITSAQNAGALTVAPVQGTRSLEERLTQAGVSSNARIRFLSQFTAAAVAPAAPT